MTRGRYFFSALGAPHFPGFHNLGSRNWTSDERDPVPALGEQTLPQVWDRGGFPVPFPPAIQVGSADCLGSGETFPNPAAARTLVAGVDSRCWSLGGVDVPGLLVGSGGGKGDGAAILSAGHLLQGSGGGKGDGAAILSAGHLLQGSGGGKGDGAAILSAGHLLQGSGGGKGGGAAILSAGHLLQGSGGGKGDGSSTLEADVAITGSIIAWPVSAVPTHWLECDGSAVSRTTFADLFTLLGVLYGIGDGGTTFNVPDLRSRSPIGAGQGTGLTNRVLATAGGAETVAMNATNLPSHTHTIGTAGSHNVAPGLVASPFFGAGNTGASGAGIAHANMHPWLALKFIIKT